MSSSGFTLVRTYDQGINFAEFLFWEILIIIIALGLIASIFAGPGATTEWYQNLNKPSWTPPNWVFSMVWTIMYLLVALTGYTGVKSDPTKAVFSSLLVIGMILNVLWSFVFFGLQNILGAFITIVLLDIIVFIQIIYLVTRKNRPAIITGCALIVYLVWLIYATTINGYLLTS